MLELKINHGYAYEMECLARIFYPGEKIRIVQDGDGSGEGGSLSALVHPLPEGARLEAAVSIGTFSEKRSAVYPDPDPARQERKLGSLLFELLCKQAGRRPPWGILTGVRPVRLYNSFLEKGMTDKEAAQILEQEFLARPEKIALTMQTSAVERDVLRRGHPDGYSLYISIPFCPSRCLYCSFVSHDIEKAAKLVPDYLRCLCTELAYTAKLAGELGLRLQSVYIGGGTPTTLEPGGLEQILKAVEAQFDLSHLVEYTVEAGRPDTITREKLEILRRYGVERISVNPQTMNDQILERIGRNHSAAQIEESLELVRGAGFGTVNMDIIAGLPGETDESFDDTVERILRLAPENITVHTLTVKRSSTLRESADAFQGTDLDLSSLLDRSRARLSERGYRPYYLYRQKGTVQNLENVGYSLPGRESAYNVWIMEEMQTVFAVGAGGATKLYAPPDRLQRFFNFKYPYEYIGRFHEMLERKDAAAEQLQVLRRAAGLP